jgi:hypothetical protein
MINEERVRIAKAHTSLVAVSIDFQMVPLSFCLGFQVTSFNAQGTVGGEQKVAFERGSHSALR